MRYFKTKYEKDATKITLLIALILVLFLFLAGPKYIYPPKEYGVAVNFGTSQVGKGTIPTKKLIQQEPNSKKESTNASANTTSAEESKKSTVASEELLTQDLEEALAIQKNKEKAAKIKAEKIAKAKAEAERLAKQKQQEEEKKKKLDALIGGVKKTNGEETATEGNDNELGNKGNPKGSIYAPSYFGDPGTGSGGVGYGLNGRGIPTKRLYKQNCNEAGMVIVRIEVNRNGEVITAIPGVKGTTNTANCLLEPAKKIALSHKWKADPKAPFKQIGFVQVNFNLGQ